MNKAKIKSSGHENAQTVSPEEPEDFKEWFRNSAAIDEETGRPLILYHGTNTNFASFDETKIGENTGSRGFIGSGFYFTTSKRDAANYGNTVMEVYLKINKLCDLTKTNSKIAAMLPGLKMKNGITFKDAFGQKREIERGIKDINVQEAAKGFYELTFEYKGQSYFIPNISPLELQAGDNHMRERATEKIMAQQDLSDPDNTGALGNYFGASTLRNEMIRNGYDGAVSHGTNLGDVGKEYVVFSPTQIKTINNINQMLDKSKPNKERTKGWRKGKGKNTEIER